MSFTDYQYYFFIFILLCFVLFIREDRRWFLLLGFSLFFYSYGRWEYLILLMASISIDYFCAIKIASSKSLIKRRFLLVLSITINLGILFFFKYLTEFYESWSWIEVRTNILNSQIENILLPLGISFYTLQSMGYTIDVYRKTVQPEYHFGYFSLYVCFFPQLVAGPIERPQRLLPQLRQAKQINIQRLESGLFLIGFGLFKKLVVADRLFVLLNDNLSSYQTLAGWQALSFGTAALLAVYLDISAYTDIARGSARLFGIELTRNFKRPMLAYSLGEFWQRWHISLSNWMMDYLFRPLAQLSRSKIHRYFALIATFMIIGLWHGPTLPFILMGTLQGIVIVLERIAFSNGLILPKTIFFNILRLLRTHVILNISGVLFLSSTMEVAANIYEQMFYFESFWGNTPFKEQLHGYWFFFLLLGGAIAVLITNMIIESPIARSIVSKSSIWIRCALLYSLFFVVLAFAERTSDDFLYFIF